VVLSVKAPLSRMRDSPENSSRFSSSSAARTATLVRLLLLLLSLFETDLSAWIKSPVLSSILVDPVFTFLHVREAISIRHLVDPIRPSFQGAYAAPETIHLPPLLLAICEACIYYLPVSEILQRLAVGLLLILTDFMVARCLETISQAAIYRLDVVNSWEESLQEKIPTPLVAPLAHVFEVQRPIQEKSVYEDTEPTLLASDDFPKLVSMIYYGSPVTMLTISCGCFKSIQTLLLMQSISQACLSTGSVAFSALCLAAAAYTDIHCGVMLVPIGLIMSRKSKKDAQRLAVAWGLFALALQGLSFLLVGSDRYSHVFRITHLNSFSLIGLTPSLSTLWYLSMELFGRFRIYFSLLLGGIPYMLILPLTIRLYRYPFALVRERLNLLKHAPSSLRSLTLVRLFTRLPSFGRLGHSFALLARCTA
jgi:hypothetical protein